MDIFDLVEQRQEIGKLCREQFLHRRFRVDDEAENLRQDIALREPDFFRIDPGVGHDRVDQIFLIFAVHDRESAVVTERAAVPAQHAVADGVKRSAPNPARVDRQQVRDPIQHLPRSLVREREQQNISGVDPVFEQIRYAISERAGLARARTGDDEQRTRRRRHGRQLLLIQLRRVIDMDRCRSGGALQRILTGHKCLSGSDPVTLLLRSKVIKYLSRRFLTVVRLNA